MPRLIMTIKHMFQEQDSADNVTHCFVGDQPKRGEELNGVESPDPGISIKELQEGAEEECEKPPCPNIRGEIAELILQQGFITLFWVAFPILPVFGFLNNLLEFRIDLFNLTQNQRMIPPL